MNKYRALVFDLDGTLVDSQIDFVSMRRELKLRSDEPILEAITAWPAVQQRWAHDIVHAHEVQGAKMSTAIQGAVDLLTSCCEEKLPIGVFTRNSRATAEWTIKMHHLPIDLLISRDDGKPKPDPEGLLRIAESFKVQPQEMLFIGDYLYDLQAGLRAGVPTALYLPSPADFDTSGATFLFQEYAQLQAWLFSSPG